MLKLKTATPRWVIVILDLSICLFSLGLAYFIRFDMNTNLKAMRSEWIYNWKEFTAYIVIKLLIFYAFQIHKGLVRYTSTQDAKRILFASMTCTGIFIAIS
ncbi:MAG: hypothetical protein EB023_12780, partial [Flavobacteriia bacterium]|nr:hypothetical protein [Flavobacteriia bacterium]